MKPALDGCHHDDGVSPRRELLSSRGRSMAGDGKQILRLRSITRHLTTLRMTTLREGKAFPVTPYLLSSLRQQFLNIAGNALGRCRRRVAFDYIALLVHQKFREVPFDRVADPAFSAVIVQRCTPVPPTPLARVNPASSTRNTGDSADTTFQLYPAVRVSASVRWA